MIVLGIFGIVEECLVKAIPLDPQHKAFPRELAASDFWLCRDGRDVV